MGLSLGEAYLELKAPLKGLAVDLKKAHGAIKKSTSKMQASINKIDFKKVGRNFTMAGAAITGALTLMTKNFMNAGDEIHKMSIRTSFAAETLSELKYAAEISGSNINELEKGVKKMSKTILDASEGMTTYERAFKRIGLESKDLIDLKPEDQFMRIAQAIEKVENPTIRAATAQDIFGRAGTKLLPLFAAGADGLEKLRKEARDTGNVFSTAGVESAAELTDAMTTLKASLGGLSKTLISTLLPSIKSGIQHITDTVKKMREWAEEHPGLAKAIMSITLAVGGLLLILGPLAIALTLLNVAAGPIFIILGAIAGAIVLAVIAFKNWDKIVAYTKYGVEALRTYLETMVENIRRIGTWIYENFPKFFVDAFNAIKTFTINFGKNIGAFVSAIAKKITHPFEKIKWPSWTPLLEGFKSTVEKFPTMAKVNLDKAKEELKIALDGMKEIVEKIPKIEPIDTEITISSFALLKKELSEMDAIIFSTTLSGAEYYQAMIDQWGEKNAEWLTGMQEITSQMGNVYDSFLGLRKQKLSNAMNKEIKIIEGREKRGVITAETAAAKIELVKENYRKKEIEAAKKMKPIKIAQAISGAALAVINALQTKPFIPLGLIAAAMASAAGAAQIAIIAAQPYERGGLVTRPTLAVLGESGPERVLNPRETKRYEKGLGGDTFYVTLQAFDIMGFEDFLNTRGREPTIRFIKEAKRRREL